MREKTSSARGHLERKARTKRLKQSSGFADSRAAVASSTWDIIDANINWSSRVLFELSCNDDDDTRSLSSSLSSMLTLVASSCLSGNMCCLSPRLSYILYSNYTHDSALLYSVSGNLYPLAI